uniref:Truncated adhesin/invasin n=1 Tax=Neisseria meningitidis TaxID=487 RepID=V9TRY7_NEIME|nr:truncated adhesin/invasin [Neisseria meningitidis]
MKHFPSKVLTTAILATFCSGALAATNDDDVKLWPLLLPTTMAKKSTVSKLERPSTTLMKTAQLPKETQLQPMLKPTTLKVWV